jgi:hypothetical protein
MSIACVWWVGLLTAGSFQAMRLGRGVPDDTDDGSLLARFIYTDLNIEKPWVVRGAWGLIVAIVGGGPGFVYLSKYVLWPVFGLVNFACDALVEALRLPAWAVEFVEGAALGSIVLFI